MPCFMTEPILFCKNKNKKQKNTRISVKSILKMISSKWLSFIYNIFVMFCGYVFQQTVGIPVGTNCALLLVNLFLCLYYADFIEGLSKKTKWS